MRDGYNGQGALVLAAVVPARGEVNSVWEAYLV